MLRSSSRPRTSGFHPGDQGFESPTEYAKPNGPVDEQVKSLPFQGKGCGFDPRRDYKSNAKSELKD